MRVANDGSERRPRHSSRGPEDRFEASRRPVQEKIARVMGTHQMSLERIRSVAHGRERTERTRSRENSAQAANAHIERKSVQRGSNAHHFRSKFTIPGPRFPSGVREPDFQVLAHCILAMTAE